MKSNSSSNSNGSLAAGTSLKGFQHRAEDIEAANALLSQMTIEEKVGQLHQSDPSKGGLDGLELAAREGRLGSLLNIVQPDEIRRLQEIAVNESRLGIPLIIGRDVIHGFRTALPIPLGLSATWNPSLIESGAAMSAAQTRPLGIHWAFGPMMDITRDPRWGRVAESPGEDPFLGCAYAKAMVKGLQGEDLRAPDRLAACAKHFAGYGASLAGRDYNTTWISDQELWEVHLPTFNAAVEAGVATFMAGFNDLNGTPVTGSRFLLTDVLRNRWNFKGMVVSDYNSVIQITLQGAAENARETAIICAQAGLDMEMGSTSYAEHLVDLVNEGVIVDALLDAAVLNVLKLKFALGLFDQPFPQKGAVYPPAVTTGDLEIAEKAALESIVLLKNERDVLPLDTKTQRIALIGPLADQPYEQMGTWIFDGQREDSLTVRDAFAQKASEEDFHYAFAEGLTHSRDTSTTGFHEAIEAAKNSDVIVFVGGEESLLSGESRCRTDLTLPGAQADLLAALAETGKPIVLVVMAGRPLILEDQLPIIDGLLYAWHPGTMGGTALLKLLSGEENPSGKLPISFPRTVGQIPIYYSTRATGRPHIPEDHTSFEDIPREQPQTTFGFDTHYLDVSNEPRFVFGEGLSYSDFEISKAELDRNHGDLSTPLSVSFILKNNSQRTGAQVAQLYIHDRFAKITRPLRELKAFRKVSLEAGEEKTITFELTAESFSYPNSSGEPQLEAGEFEFYLGFDSHAPSIGVFRLE